MDLGLKNKTAIVMASSQGLGKAMAMELAKEGANVMLFSRNLDQLLSTQKEMEEVTGNKPSYTVGDVSKVEDIKKLIQNTIDEYGSIYALVNNAGGPPAGIFDAFDDEAWQKAFDLTLMSYIRAIREVLPYMRKNGSGRILNSTSSSVKNVLDNLILSNTFRMGVVGLSKTLSQELGKDNILVNVIAPGRIATARIEHLDHLRAQKAGITSQEVRENTNRNIPLGRYGNPEEYGKLAAFLCSETNTYITGQTILADGGMVKAF